MVLRPISTVAGVAAVTLLLLATLTLDGIAGTQSSVSVSAPDPASGTVTVSAKAKNNVRKLDKLEVYVDGSLKATCSATPCNYLWNTLSSANGSHNLVAKRRDQNGAVTTSAPLSVLVANGGDIKPPSVSLSVPASIAGTVTVSASASDPSGIKSLTVYLDSSPILTTAADALAISWDSTRVANGSHTFQARATDTVGNTGQSASKTVTVDNSGAPPPPPPPPPSAGLLLFPANAVWNLPIDAAPLHPQNAWLMDYLVSRSGHPLHPDFGTVYNGRLNGIPVNYVQGNSVPKAPVTITSYASESDPVPAGGLPIPTNVVIEGDPAPDPSIDRHMLIVDTDNHRLHEFYSVDRLSGGGYRAAQYSTWDYQSNALRPDGWTSSDAAGLPVANLLVQYDEVQAAVASGGTVPHAFRFTIEFSSNQLYLWPARHLTLSGDPNRPPFGMRVRLKKNFDISGYSPTNQAILRTLKKYGMLFADNGGDWFISGAPDPRWDDEDLHLLTQIIPHDAFEVVDVSGWMVDPDSAKALP